MYVVKQLYNSLYREPKQGLLRLLLCLPIGIYNKFNDVAKSW